MVLAETAIAIDSGGLSVLLLELSLFAWLVMCIEPIAILL